MTNSILITQCLQNDFVELIDKYEVIPNQLHVGFEEAKRLLGEKIEDGPVNTLIEWAYDESNENLTLVHIRDWHDKNDPKQKNHLIQFGDHCIGNTHGADFVFSNYIKDTRKHQIVNASGLNDFLDTNLEEILKPFENKSCRVGIAGVWTEAKITFLAYELKTRYPEFEIATCSLVTASSSRASHFIALEALENILGIKVYTSLAEFTNFLNGSTPKIENRIKNASFVNIKFEDNYNVSDMDRQILLYLYRDAKEAEFKCLDGGFSGNVVLKAKVIDKYGHTQVPTVVKIGEREPVSKERNSFEKIQEVLGNNAPSIVDFAELGNRGAIKYRYASMLDGNVRTFQKYYAASNDTDKLCDILDIVYVKQLGRLYEAATQEKLNLLTYYDFQAKYASGVRARVKSIIGVEPSGDTIDIEGYKVPNVCNFYEHDLLHLKEKTSLPRFTSYIHGDLNGANIIVDAQENVWIIDFFHTHKGHILKDLIKMENDIIYIFMKIENSSDFKEAVTLVDHLLSVSDLGIPLNPLDFSKWKNPEIEKAFKTIAHLRSYYTDLIHTDRDPYQLFAGLMRYAMHTLSFDESNDWQKKLALYAGAFLSEKIKKSLYTSGKLRIDFINSDEFENSGKMALTILPGRKDRDRDIEEDIMTIHDSNIHNVLCLVTEHELEEYGVPDLKKEYLKAGLEFKHLPILDQSVPTIENLEPILTWMNNKLTKGENILIHCIGGLGRSGTIAACYLRKFLNYSDKRAIETVRAFRSRRAVESKAQEEFIQSFME